LYPNDWQGYNMDDFKVIARVEDIPIGRIKPFEIDNFRFLVAHTESGFYAVINECSHDSAEISNGHLHDDQITCLRHGARFDLKTGAVTAPPAVVPIDTIELKIENDKIYVQLSDL